MDSSSSGSMQYSGGGDEEFDSRGEPFSAFLNSSRTSNQGFAEMSPIQPPPPPPPRFLYHHQNHPSSFVDPLPTCLDIFTQSTSPPTASSLLNLDMVLSRGFNSAPSCSHSSGLMGSSTSSAHQVPRHQTSFQNPFSMPSSSGHENIPRPSAPSDPGNVGIRNPKKRSRASRRAPTTVLTTDTSNFRAMVQEFTGIPPPPFSASPFLGNRLNLFSTSSNMRSALRPFAHKVLPPSLLTSSVVAPYASSTNNIASSSANTTNTTTTTTTITPTSSSNPYNPTSSNNNQLPFELSLFRESEDPMNMLYPMLTFQSHLQPPPKYTSPNVPIFGAKSQTSSTTGSVSEEFNTSRGMLNADHIVNATKPLNDEWAFIEEQH